MNRKFRIYYDDMIPSIVEEISKNLEPFELKIISTDYDDGWEEYEIVKCNEKNKDK